MANLLSILSSAASSLQGQEAGFATSSNNVENANTPGYARQIAVIEANTPTDQVSGANIGTGSQLETVTQVRDQFVEAQIPVQMGLAYELRFVLRARLHHRVRPEHWKRARHLDLQLLLGPRRTRSERGRHVVA